MVVEADGTTFTTSTLVTETKQYKMATTHKKDSKGNGLTTKTTLKDNGEELRTKEWKIHAQVHTVT